MDRVKADGDIEQQWRFIRLFVPLLMQYLPDTAIY
jgi:hypothetical protein